MGENGMQKHHNDGHDKPPLDIMIELLACTTQADGMVSTCEKEMAQAILSDIAPDQASQVKQLYHSAIHYYSMEDRRKNLHGLIENLPITQQLSILRTLWALALSDGQIHPDEQTMIMDLMIACGLDENLSAFELSTHTG